MTATAQAAPPQRKPFRLSRYKPSEFGKSTQQQQSKPQQQQQQSKPQQQQQQQHMVRPSGGSSQKEPFDPAELARKLEIYLQDLKLARARKEIADMNNRAKQATREVSSPQERHDSGYDDAGKSETSSLESGEASLSPSVPAVVASVLASVPEEKPTQKAPSIRRPRHERRMSSSRSRRNAPGTYFPRFAAKQFSATTTPLPTKQPKDKKAESTKQGSSSAVKDTTTNEAPGPKPMFVEDIPMPKQFTKDIPMPKPMERSSASAPSLGIPRSTSVSARRSSAMLSPSPNHRTTAGKPRPLSSVLPRPISTAMDHLTLNDDEPSSSEQNPYILSAPQTSRKSDFTDAEKKGIAADLQRPQLNHGDRHDWSQASQCGDSARHSIHLHSIWRSKDEQQQASSLSAPRDGKARGKSHGDLPGEQHLISDAVKLVNKERRKSSFMGFLKRHHH